MAHGILLEARDTIEQWMQYSSVDEKKKNPSRFNTNLLPSQQHRRTV